MLKEQEDEVQCEVEIRRALCTPPIKVSCTRTLLPNNRMEGAIQQLPVGGV